MKTTCSLKIFTLIIGSKDFFFFFFERKLLNTFICFHQEVILQYNIQ